VFVGWLVNIPVTMRALREVIRAVALMFVAAAAVQAEEPSNSASTNTCDLTQLRLEDLMRVKVFSVSKHLQPWFTAPAAIYVITGEDIHRAGATSLPEALRLAPGMDVARMNVHAWAVSARGFNSLFSDKLLVMVDGRSVYTPVFSGVWWNAQDILLENVDRIEVMRGVDGTLWGANAVNGVINVITKSAKETQGLLVTGGGGTEEQGFGAVRYGGQLDDQTWYRVYGKGYNRAQTYEFDGPEDWSRSQQARGGFRVDREAGDNTWLLQGDGFSAVDGGIGVFPDLASPTLYQVTTGPSFHTWGGNLLGRWTHLCAGGAEWTLQTYYDFERRSHVYAINEERHTGDVDFQCRFPVGERHSVTVGGDYRVSADHLRPTLGIGFDPVRRTLNLFSGFVQDEIVLAPDRLRLTLGVKLEHNDYSGLEWQPSARLAWTPTPQQTWWAAASRAVRMPARNDRDMRIGLGALDATTLINLYGSPATESEKVVGLELGYRVQPAATVLFDVAAFYNFYTDLRAARPGTPFPADTYVVVPYYYGAFQNGETYGAELLAEWRPASWCRLQATYAWLEMRLRRDAPDVVSYTGAGDSPRHQVGLRATLDLPGRVELDAGLRWVDELPAQSVSSYLAGNVRVAWRPNAQWEVAVVGQHLGRTHAELGRSFVIGAERVPASVYGQVTWRY
jgi:iron complex outermembrane receptor protein